MEYRKLPRGNEEISILGLGTSSIGMAGQKEIEKTVTMALEAGINYFDMASADAAPFEAFGRAVAGNRNQVYFQIHFGADYQTGKYGWTLQLDDIRRSVLIISIWGLFTALMKKQTYGKWQMAVHWRI